MMQIVDVLAKDCQTSKVASPPLQQKLESTRKCLLLNHLMRQHLGERRCKICIEESEPHADFDVDI